MTDMLVKLYALPPLMPEIEVQAAHQIEVRRAIAPEKHLVIAWVRAHFSDYWASETEVAFSNRPNSCFLAAQDGALIGFGCYDATARGFFGPTGVIEAGRGKGTGKALLLACLHDMGAQGYGYAVIGGVGPVEFYEKAAGAVVIPDSTPGIYRGMLRPTED
jgi:GNAT superfamily N-acetyltransferase